MTDLPALIARLEQAEGPSRELDAEIMAACFDWAKPEPPYYAPMVAGDEPIYWHAPSWAQKQPAPHLTSSIDAAVAFVERVLPPGTPIGFDSFTKCGAPIALHMCLATLRAVQENRP